MSAALRQYRAKLQFSQRQFADRLGVPSETYRVWESGRRPAPPDVLTRAREFAGSPDDRTLLPLRVLASMVGVHVVRNLRQMGRRAIIVLTGFDLDAAPMPDNLHPLIAAAVRTTHRTRASVYAPLARRFEDDVRRRSLARARGLLVARMNRVRERDLH